MIALQIYSCPDALASPIWFQNVIFCRFQQNRKSSQVLEFSLEDNTDITGLCADTKLHIGNRMQADVPIKKKGVQILGLVSLANKSVKNLVQYSRNQFKVIDFFIYIILELDCWKNSCCLNCTMCLVWSSVYLLTMSGFRITFLLKAKLNDEKSEPKDRPTNHHTPYFHNILVENMVVWPTGIRQTRRT